MVKRSKMPKLKVPSLGAHPYWSCFDGCNHAWWKS